MENIRKKKTISPKKSKSSKVFVQRISVEIMSGCSLIGNDDGSKRQQSIELFEEIWNYNLVMNLLLLLNESKYYNVFWNFSKWKRNDSFIETAGFNTNCLEMKGESSG